MTRRTNDSRFVTFVVSDSELFCRVHIVTAVCSVCSSHPDEHPPFVSLTRTIVSVVCSLYQHNL